jgi:predicted lipid-binding transport protein (Tim44 family)
MCIRDWFLHLRAGAGALDEAALAAAVAEGAELPRRGGPSAQPARDSSREADPAQSGEHPATEGQSREADPAQSGEHPAPPGASGARRAATEAHPAQSEREPTTEEQGDVTEERRASEVPW